MKTPSLWLLASATAMLGSAEGRNRLQMNHIESMLAEEDVRLVPGERFLSVGKPSELKVTSNTVKLTRADGVSLSSLFIQADRKRRAAAMGVDLRLASPSISLISVHAGSVFLAPITIGGQNFNVVIDTGSSDPWVASKGFVCYDPDTGSAYASNTQCGFGSTYDPSASSTYSTIANQNFNVSYADGEFLNGEMAYETMTMAGVTVQQQKFGDVDYANWYGDGISSGLVGFSYSSLTSAYQGSHANEDVKGHTVPYDPLFVSMYKNNLVSPVFSIALSRNASEGGLLSLGGIPNIAHGTYWANATIEPISVDSTTGENNYQYYSVMTAGYAVSGNRSAEFNLYNATDPNKVTVLGNQTNTIIDSGTTLAYVPDDVAEAAAAAFEPPATWSDYFSAYTVKCNPYVAGLNVTAPKFGAAFNGKIFFANPADLVLYVGPDENGDPTCMSGVQPSFQGYSLLGDAWMKSVLCVFDIGAGVMRFASREYYSLYEQAIKPS